MRTWPSTVDPPCMARRQSWAREDWGHTGRGAAETYTAPGFTTATWPDPRIQRLRTKNELTQGVCKAAGSPADKSTFPHLHGAGGQSSRPAALLSAVGPACLQETGEHLTSASSPNPTPESHHPDRSSRNVIRLRGSGLQEAKNNQLTPTAPEDTS